MRRFHLICPFIVLPLFGLVISLNMSIWLRVAFAAVSALIVRQMYRYVIHSEHVVSLNDATPHCSYFTVEHSYLIVPLGVYLSTFFWLNATWLLSHFFYVGWAAVLIHAAIIAVDCYVFQRVWLEDPGFVSRTHKVLLRTAMRIESAMLLRMCRSNVPQSSSWPSSQTAPTRPVRAPSALPVSVRCCALAVKVDRACYMIIVQCVAHRAASIAPHATAACARSTITVRGLVSY